MPDQPAFSYRPQTMNTRALHALVQESYRDFSVDLDALSTFGATNLLGGADAAPARNLTEFEQTVADLVARGMAEEALGRVERRLARAPADSTLLYLRGDLLLGLGRYVAAAAAIHEALDVVDERSQPRFTALLDKVVQQERDRNLAEIRRRLRGGDVREAAQQLGACSPDMMADQHVIDLDTYIRERLARRTRSWPSLRRSPPVQPLSQHQMQSLLHWLLHDDLYAGLAALNAGEYAAAAKVLAAAEAIDDRCSLVAFLHALVLYAGVRAGYRSTRPAVVEPFLGDLARADDLAARAAGDPSWQEEAAGLVEQIARTRELIAHNELVDTVNQLIRRFNDMMGRFLRRPISTYSELTDARMQVHKLWLETLAAGERVTPGSEDAKVVRELEDAIGAVRRQLQR